MDIVEDDLTGAATRALLELHLAGMFETSPAENVFALDQSGLKAPGITVWTVREGRHVLGIGALKRHDGVLGEIKSMRTHPDHLRRGVAAMLLDHIVATAHRERLRRLSLETGRGPAFDAAIALYLRRGFAFGESFADYRPSHFSQFMHLALV